MKTRFIVTVVLLAAASLSASPQGQRQGGGAGMTSNMTGSVVGKVTDKLSKTPVEYANVAFYRLRDSSLVTGGITNE
ncbi:MAG: hypothetical protein RBR30_14050, partial [Tenuifilaceae bacterium]|nr:hypothetical protein [Tenuifilaceae bacterium]